MSASQFGGTFRTFFWWGMEAWTLPSPVLAVGLLSLGSVFLCIFRQRQMRAHWRASYWLIFTQLLFYPLIIAVGVGFQADTTGPIRAGHPNARGEHLLDVLTWASLVTGCFWVYRMKGFRWLAVSLVVLQEVMIFGAMFIAGMSVTGDWL